MIGSQICRLELDGASQGLASDLASNCFVAKAMTLSYFRALEVGLYVWMYF